MATGRLLNQADDQASDAQAEIRRLESRLAAASRDLEGFAHAVSHDLRAPLRAIHQLADITLRDGATLDPESALNLEAMRDSAQKASLLVDALVRFARLGGAQVAPTRVDLAPMAREIMANLSRGSAREVALDIPDTLPAHADPDQARALLEVLLRNAWTYTRDAPRARIALRAEGDAFVVEDDGPGFDVGRTARLFEPFPRVWPHSPHAGPGLGLAMARRIVEAHGGKIAADSAPNKGTRISFTLG